MRLWIVATLVALFASIAQAEPVIPLGPGVFREPAITLASVDCSTVKTLSAQPITDTFESYTADTYLDPEANWGPGCQAPPFGFNTRTMILDNSGDQVVGHPRSPLVAANGCAAWTANLFDHGMFCFTLDGTLTEDDLHGWAVAGQEGGLADVGFYFWEGGSGSSINLVRRNPGGSFSDTILDTWVGSFAPSDEICVSNFRDAVGLENVEVSRNGTVILSDSGAEVNLTGPFVPLAFMGNPSSALWDDFKLARCSDPPPPLPQRSNGSPSGTLASGTTSTPFSLNTQFNATCRYGPDPGIAYASLPSEFASTGGTTHTDTNSGLVDGGSYLHHVKCENATGANTNDFIISYSVATPPPLAIINMVASPGDGVVNVDFDDSLAPDHDHHEARWKLDSDPDLPGSWSLLPDPPTSDFQVGGLTNGVAIDVQARDCSTMTCSAWEERTATPAAVVAFSCTNMFATYPQVDQCHDFEDPALNVNSTPAPPAWEAAYGAFSCEGTPGCLLDVHALGECDQNGEGPNDCILSGTQSLGLFADNGFAGWSTWLDHVHADQ